MTRQKNPTDYAIQTTDETRCTKIPVFTLQGWEKVTANTDETTSAASAVSQPQGHQRTFSCFHSFLPVTSGLPCRKHPFSASSEFSEGDSHFCQRGGGCRGEGWCFGRSLWPDLTSAFRSRVSHLFFLIFLPIIKTAQSRPLTESYNLTPTHMCTHCIRAHTHLCTRQAAPRCD